MSAMPNEFDDFDMTEVEAELALPEDEWMKKMLS